MEYAQTNKVPSSVEEIPSSTEERMRRDEALVFKVYDSEKDGRARFTPHTSFDDPATPGGAPPRQSIEARALAFF